MCRKTGPVAQQFRKIWYYQWCGGAISYVDVSLAKWPAGAKKFPVEGKEEKSQLTFFWEHCYCFWMLIHCPALLMVCIIMRLELDTFNSITRSAYRGGRALLSQVEGRGEEEEGVCTAGLQNKLLPEITASVLLYMPFEPGRNTCLGLQEQHMVMLCKTKRSCRSWCCSLQVVTRPQGFLRKKNKGRFRINIPS